MRNRFYVHVITTISIILMLCGCYGQDDSDKAEDKSRISISDINNVQCDMSFNELIEYYSVKLDEEYYDPFDGVFYREGYARYYRDYSQMIEKMHQDEIEYNDPGQVEDYEYHINRAYVDSQGFVFLYEYDNTTAAFIRFREVVDKNVSSAEEYPNLYNVCDLSDEGILLVSYPRNDFGVVYMIGRMIMIYDVKVSNNDQLYSLYLDICHDLGIPSSDEITEMIQ